MIKHFYSLPPLLTALSLAQLFSLFLLVACGTGADTANYATSTAVNPAISDTAVGDKKTLEREIPVTAAPNAKVGFDCLSVNQIPYVECEALVGLYNSTNGPGWDDNAGWLETVTPCTWSGIECTHSHVSGINLGYNQLTGILPPELGNLTHLRVLGLSSNRLHGSIAAEVRNLSELVSLELGGNQLEGAIPDELSDLPYLRTLSLSKNKLRGSIPPALGNIRSLESLVLSFNQLSSAIPPELGNLTNLRILYLSHNMLSGGIPAALSRLTKLDELDLSYNRLSGPVPESISQISGRSLWGNKLEGTITANGNVPFAVDYIGVHFSADPSLADSIWPEVKPATPLPEDPEGPSYWLAIPEHIRFTFADPDLSPSRQRMGFNLAAEGQVLIFPLAEVVDINPLVQTRIETLQNLLVERGTIPSGELPLLPLTNSAQVFHAQAQYLGSENIKGFRFISQHSQDPAPILLSQELFYTFQGFTTDGAYYVAAFFPLTTAILPDTIEVDDWDAFHANYDTYLSETTAELDQLLPAEFTPNITLLDAVITSLLVETNDGLYGKSTPPFFVEFTTNVGNLFTLEASCRENSRITPLFQYEYRVFKGCESHQFACCEIVL